MKSRIRFAAAGLAAMTVIGALTSSAGASTTSWNAKANGGALDVTLLGKQLELAGGITEADANSANTAEAMGTGLCISNGTPGPCPTDVTSATGQSLSTTAKAIQNGADGTQAPGQACVASLPLVLATIGVGCGNATASEQGGNPTAEGDGSVLGGSVNVTMGNALNAMGISLPSAANAPCAGTSTPAASSSPGSGTSSLPAPAASLLGTVNTIIGGLKLPTLNPTTVSQNTPQDSTCSILGGLVNQISGVPVLGSLVGSLVNGTSLNGVMGTSLLSVGAVESKSTIATSTAGNGDTVETANAIGDGLDVNVMGGMLDIKVIPAVATASVDRATGQTTENCTPGLIQVTVNNGTPNLVSLQALGTALNQLLSQLEATALQPLLDALLQVPAPGILNCEAPVGSGNTTSVTGGEANLVLLPVAGVGGLIGLHVNNVTASASSTSATPPGNPATSPAQTPGAKPAANPVAAPAAPAAVPNVTSVHTGEFWAGTLPIILMIGMALGGSLLIGRRRVTAVARNLSTIARRRGGH